MSSEEVKTKSMYCLAVQLCIKPERRKEFLECIANNQRGTLSSAEPLALEYLYGEDATTPNTFHFFEKYKGKEGFEAHQKAPHFAVWEKFAATDPFTSPPEIAFFEEVGPAPNRGKGKGKGKGKDVSAYCLNVHFNIKPDRREEFLDAIKAGQKATLNEQLAMSFVIGQDTSDQNRLYLFEKYVGKAGFDAHCATEHFKEIKNIFDSGILVSDPIVFFYPEARQALPLTKPKFGKVKSIKPDSKGLNLMLKCLKCDEIDEGSSKSWRAVLGDDTGVVTFSLRDASQSALCKEGSSLRIQNARAIMVKNRINVIVDKFGVLKAAEEAIEGDVDSANDVSATEFELVGS